MFRSRVGMLWLTDQRLIFRTDRASTLLSRPPLFSRLWLWSQNTTTLDLARDDIAATIGRPHLRFLYPPGSLYKVFEIRDRQGRTFLLKAAQMPRWLTELQPLRAEDGQDHEGASG